MLVYGLGKLGGFELNYSSDIDLIMLYDPEHLPARDIEEAGRPLVRLARNFISLLSERTRDGYVFRVDLRLRPDPGATPLVMSTEAAEHYYEARGQTWERAALIKARAIAGDIPAAAGFLSRIEPFVWRRHLDFATVQELHGMKKQIDAHHGTGRIKTLGHNLKLGRGGIREIEFFAQSQQLVWAGKNARLRTIATCTTLRALADAGHISAAAAENFINSYRFLRRAEHRVQMVRDEQTHALPAEVEEYAAITRFLGYRDPQVFTDDLIAVLRSVEHHYADYFELPLEIAGDTREGPGGGQSFDVEQLARMGFAQPENVIGILEKWRSGRYRVAHGPRSRELLAQLTPSLLTAVLGTADPDLAMARLDRLLAGMPAGLQVFSLFQANLHVMETMANILVSAPIASEQLMRRPELFEALLEWDTSEIVPGRQEFEKQLSLLPSLEERVDCLGNWVDGARLRVAIHLLFSRLDPLDAARALSEVADFALTALLAEVQRAFAKKHGRIAGAGVAILGMGRLGGGELSITSDLDLVLVYDAPENAESKGNGIRQLAATTYYNRLLRRLLSALGDAVISSGPIYQIDMRLRPSGNAGPLATSLDAFETYHAESAWTWEQMALTRARIVYGTPAMQARLETAITATLQQKRDPESLRQDVAEMRLRMDREYHTDSPWGFKHYRGGLVDIEFITQYLILRHAHARPEILATNTYTALRALAEGGLLTKSDAARLLDSWQLWTRLQALQRLIGEQATDAEIPQDLRPLFSKAAGIEMFTELPARMAEAAAGIQEIYQRIVGPPAPAKEK